MNINNKYLVEPFRKEVTSKKFAESTNLLKMIVGTTGLGKTFCTYNEFIPYLFEEEDVELVLYTYPNTEVFDILEANAVIANTKGVVMVTNPREVESNLRAGYKVFLACTHKMLLQNEYLLDRFIGLGNTMGWFIDEPHTWLAASHRDNYKDTTGNYNVTYDANLYRMVSKVAAKSPYIFATTATPTNEHKHLVEPFGDMKFKIINDYPTVSDMIPFSGWMGGVSFFDLNDADVVLNRFLDAMDSHREKNELYGKRTMIIQVEARDGSGGYNVDYVLDMIKYYLIGAKSTGYNGEDRVAILTADEKSIRSLVEIPGLPDRHGMAKAHYCEEDIIGFLNNPDHPVNIVIVVNKGKCGMNIMNAKSQFVFRHTDKKASKDLGCIEIVEGAVQFIGRLQRIWTGMPKADFVRDWGYNLTGYIDSLNTNQRKRLLELNSYDLWLPDVAMQREAVRVVREVNPTKEVANSWMNSL